MNDRQLKYIMAIAKEANLTAAAKKLYISQPSLSNLLDHVEKELGVKLFDRHSNGMRMTSAGECYIAAAQQILSCMTDLEQQLSEIRDEQRGRLRIGCSAKKSALIFPYVIPQLKRDFPLFTLQLIEDSVETLTELLLSGELDVAFLYSDNDFPHIQSHPFMEEEVCIVAPVAFTSDKLETRGEGISVLADISVLKDKPFVLFKKGKMLRKFADEFFQAADFSPNILLETDSWQTCIAMAEADEALTFLPVTSLEGMKYRRQNLPKLQYIQLTKPHFRSLSIFYRESLKGSKIMEKFLQICDETAAGKYYPEMDL